MTLFTRRALLGLTGAGTAAAALTACSPGGRLTTPASDSASAGDPPGDQERTSTGPDPSSPPAGDAGSPLVIVFSRAGENYWEGGRRDLETGNTARLASLIADRLDCPLHEIEAAEPYPQGYDATVERNVREQDADDRPEIAGDLPDLTDRDIILLGCPVWGSRAPMIISTLLDGVDLRGKRLLPFVTYAVSGMSGIDEDHRCALPETEVAEGLAVRGEEVDEAAEAVEAWLRGNGLPG